MSLEISRARQHLSTEIFALCWWGVCCFLSSSKVRTPSSSVLMHSSHRFSPRPDPSRDGRNERRGWWWKNSCFFRRLICCAWKMGTSRDCADEIAYKVVFDVNASMNKTMNRGALPKISRRRKESMRVRNLASLHLLSLFYGYQGAGSTSGSLRESVFAMTFHCETVNYFIVEIVPCKLFCKEFLVKSSL